MGCLGNPGLAVLTPRGSQGCYFPRNHVEGTRSRQRSGKQPLRTLLEAGLSAWGSSSGSGLLVPGLAGGIWASEIWGLRLEAEGRLDP